MIKFAVGSLVKARDREWVVLPESEEDLLVLRPLGGTEDEVTGIYPSLEMLQLHGGGRRRLSRSLPTDTMSIGS